MIGKWGGNVIYLDHAATTSVRPQVIESMLPYFSSTFANASGSYTAARCAHKALDVARNSVADAIGAKRSEIYFTSGGSESDNWALNGILRTCAGKKRIVTSRIEHHAILETCAALEQSGIEVVYANVDANGRVQPQEVRRLMTPDTALVSVMRANNEVGTIQPIAELAAIAHEFGALMHTDAVQAVGHIPVNVQSLGVDLLSMSAHKFCGPKGIGALYIKSGIVISPLIYGGAQEKGLRAGTENVPAIVGMGEAIRIANEQLGAQMKQIAALRDHLEQLLVASVPGIRVNGDRQNRLPGHLHISIPKMDANLLLMRLDMEGIAASSASACAAGAIERSHVIRAMGIVEDGQADLRLTLGEENTLEEIEKAVSVLKRIVVK